MDNGIVILTSVLLALSVPTGDAVYCYKKFDNLLSRDTICRGLMSEDITTFADVEDCCSHERAVAYSNELMTYGKRNMKYQCSPCPEESPIDFFDTTNDTSGWSNWGQWSPCSVTCKTGGKTRQRICHGSESFCPGIHNGAAQENLPCVVTPQCPVDGKWGIWTKWTECTRSCNNGTRRRLRSCNSPSPQYGGAVCVGDADETGECNTQPCPINGGWSDWTAEPCSVTCGKGISIKRRSCSNPVPLHGGAHCTGREEENYECSKKRCPRHGGWSFWSRWSECNVSCGEGRRLRTRDCNSPSPKFGGDDCVGNTTEVQSCYMPQLCPINGGWSGWTVWGPCYAAPCGGERGYERRLRDCTAPYPRFGGQLCEGNATEIRHCYNNYGCPVDGGWCDWEPWTDCLRSTTRFIRRTRRCECPLPVNGGSYCLGMDYDISTCDDARRTEGSGSLNGEGCDDEEDGC